ncbi:hypothetical protein ONZ51_g5184 [Trametes cubensis]|uniref:Uncharacterized protein n=1 Tax=Trametes cubensis TaxID=1111947 RepID=A0AAD7TWY9_9APHY|nr:hypothetical protein ONZ51_g5184 [Trametes cubensis]
MSSSGSDDMSSSSSTSISTTGDVPSTRIALPLPHAVKHAAVHTVEFQSADGSRGVSLAEWIRLSDKRKSELCLKDPQESLEELILDSQVLYQCQWPGYDADTCYISTPSHVAEGVAPLRKVDFLDVICERLSHWVLQTLRCKHVECTEPQWALGLDSITFEHIYVVAVVEVKGYVPNCSDAFEACLLVSMSRTWFARHRPWIAPVDKISIQSSQTLQWQQEPLPDRAPSVIRSLGGAGQFAAWAS